MTLRERFKRLTLWNKLGVIGSIASIIGIILYFFPSDSSKHAAQLTEITSLNTDLERLKVILPLNQAFSDCMKKRKGSYEKLLETCTQERKLLGDDPQQIIEKHRAALRLHFTERELEQVNEGLDSIKFFAYEMWNNQISLEGWKAKGCPDKITVLKADEIRPYTQNHKLGNCSISIENYDSFQERDAKNKNLITSTREAVVSVDNLNFLVIPGNQMTIQDLFFTKNNDLYGNMQEDVKTMRTLLKTLAK